MSSPLFLLTVLPTAQPPHVSDTENAAIQVAPVLVAIKPGHSITGVCVMNHRPRAASFRARVERWRQEHGADVFTPTNDIVVSPGAFTLERNASCRVRLAANAPDCDTERAYRISLHDADGEASTPAASIPVFISPLAERAVIKLRIQPRAWGFGLVISNEGRAYARIAQVEDLEYGALSAPQYILAGAKAYVALPPNAGPIRVRSFDIGGTRTEQMIDPSGRF
jgi:fimbrial chaperone protein